MALGRKEYSDNIFVFFHHQYDGGTLDLRDMLSPVELSLAPSCEDCLAWSPDGELAIAAGDSVQILVRVPQPGGPDNND
jgi:hypothetical protein